VSGASSIDGATQVYGVLGHPVTHSLSPIMHNAAFAGLGLNAAYVPFPVAPEGLAKVVAGLVAAGVCGFNITVPHKQAILDSLDEVLPEARAIGAVNTVRVQHGRLTGTNTDGTGFLISLAEDLAFAPAGKEVLLLGAGGAARAIAFALLGAGVERLLLSNRTAARAAPLAADCRTLFPGRRIDLLGLAELAGSAPHLVVNATSAGMGDGRSHVALAPLRVREAVLDIVYHPPETALLAEARGLGLRAANGIGMLLYQGAASFQFWTGREPPVEPMRAALLAAMAARRS
jgi:shikimate dehydrogenase